MSMLYPYGSRHTARYPSGSYIPLLQRHTLIESASRMPTVVCPPKERPQQGVDLRMQAFQPCSGLHAQNCGACLLEDHGYDTRYLALGSPSIISWSAIVLQYCHTNPGRFKRWASKLITRYIIPKTKKKKPDFRVIYYCSQPKLKAHGPKYLFKYRYPAAQLCKPSLRLFITSLC